MRRTLVGVLAASALLVDACGPEASTTADTTSPAASGADSTGTSDADASAGGDDTAAPVESSTDTRAPADVPAALQFSSPLVGGGTFEGASLAGTPAAFWFWAPT
ncbi:MAG: hypothetical protein RI958_2306 [Actinomycetota bacterium]